MNKSGLDLLREVTVTLSVELGRCQIKLKDALALGEETVVELDKLTDELLDVFVNGKAIAKGEIVAQGDRFGLRIVQMCGEDEDEINPLAAIAPAPRSMAPAPMPNYEPPAPVESAPPPPPPPPPPAPLSAADMAAEIAAEFGLSASSGEEPASDEAGGE